MNLFADLLITMISGQWMFSSCSPAQSQGILSGLFCSLSDLIRFLLNVFSLVNG